MHDHGGTVIISRRKESLVETAFVVWNAFWITLTIGALAKIIGKLISRRRPRPEAAAKPPSRSPC